jgi:hypothetical protein
MSVSIIDNSRARSGITQLIACVVAGLIVFVTMMKFGIAGLIAAVLLGMVALIAGGWPETATLVVVFVMYSDAAAVAVRSHGVPSAVAMGFFFLLLVPIVSHVIFGGESLRGDSVLVLMVAYIGPLLASALLSSYTADTLEFITKYIFEGLMIYFLIINAVRSPESLRRSLWAVVLAGAFLAGITVVQEVTKTYDKEYGGFALTKIVDSKGYVDEADTETGQVDSEGRSLSRPRASGPIGDPNFYGQILCAVLPMAAVLFFSHSNRWSRILALITTLLLVAAILLTFSRGAMVAVVVLTVLLVFLRYLKVRYLLVVFALIATAIYLNPAYQTRLSTFSFVDSHGMRQADYSVRERATILLAGVRIFLDHPLFGVGPGQSPKYIASYGNAEGYAKVRKDMEAHNTYLQQLDETGVVGFLCLFAIVAITLRNLFRVRARWRLKCPEYGHIATGLILAIVMFLTTSIFLHLAFMRYFSLLLGLAGAAVLIYRSEDLQAVNPTATKRLQ